VQIGRQDRLFYEFCLEDRVPRDHLLRRIDVILDLSWLRTSSFRSTHGQKCGMLPLMSKCGPMCAGRQHG
jgi:hypothetical protein